MRIDELSQENRQLLDSFTAMSRSVGSQPDCIQAGGGNTSIKFGDVMAVKCSGCQLKDMSLDFGYVCLPYKQICSIFAGSDRGEKSESETSGLVNSAVIKYDDLPAKRPSVEAGFHALLGNAVIHSHAVYANILNCIKGGEQIARDILNDLSIPCLFLPFINPGAELTFAIMDQKNKFGDKFPNVIFLQNHGLVVWADTADEALRINQTVLTALRDALALPDYPAVSITESGGKCISENKFISSMLKNKSLTSARIMETPLYPDQLVYLNANFSDNSKLTLTDHAVYNCAYGAAYALEETLLAYAYLLYAVDLKGYELKLMPESGIQFILGWDAEKYRRQMLK